MRNGKTKNRRRSAGAFWMIFPSYLIYFVFVFVPLVITVYLSFTNYDLYKTREFVGFANYVRLIHDPNFLIAAKNTFIYAVFVIIPQIALGLIIAVLLNRKVFGQRFHRIAFYMPNVTSMVSISIVWLWIYDPTLGLFNQALKYVGLPGQRWLFDIKLALPSIIFMSVWKLIGYNMIIYLAGLQQIPDYIYEAAKIDGASSIGQFFKITIPMLKPTTFFLFVIACVQSFSVFDQVNVMTQGGPLNATTTIVHQIFERAFSQFQMGYASSMGTVLLIICVTLTFTNFKYGNQGNDLGMS